MHCHGIISERGLSQDFSGNEYVGLRIDEPQHLVQRHLNAERDQVEGAGDAIVWPVLEG